MVTRHGATMPADEPSADRPRYCPYCGEPVGWFFGRFTADGAVWCERCQDLFRVERRRRGNVRGPPGRCLI